ncbi:MAG: acetate--CoA ligase family protein [Alphaproteobacteria bacterium]|nr:MAG: acetate--CoA ligase family protein [Alphaproteobacteria bacterium]
MESITTSRLDRLLRPRSVAIIGVSPEPGHMGGTVLANLERCRYAGAIHLVSRSRTEFNGRPCVPSIDDLPPGVDIAVLVVPQTAVIDAIAALGKRGAGAAIVFASGYAEVGEAGRADQEKLTAAAHAANVAVLGPNCIGMCSYAVGAALTFEFNVEPPPPSARPNIGMVAQSGAMAAIMRMAFLAKGLGISFYISTGNEADLTAEDFLAGLIDDADTQLAALFVEQIRKPQKFLALAARARAIGKPIVLMHAGRSQRARISASSHTGALTGDHAVATALLRHAGVVVVETLEELVDCADVLARCKPPVKGPGIITNSGAVKGFALDFCDQIGLEVPRLAPATIDTLKTVLPAFASLDNPLDITAMVLRDVSLWPRTAEAVLADPGIGSLCLPMVAGTLQYAMAKADALRPTLRAGGKPTVVALLGDDFPVPPEFLAAFRAEGIPVLRSPERALRALAHATAYGQALATGAAPASAIQAPPLPRRGTLPEYEGKAYLAALGIAVPNGALAGTAAEAKAVARRVGYPVALKAQAAALAHKSDAGGVALNIPDADALEGEWARMMERVAGAQPGLALDGILVEAMGMPGVELIVGARRDPEWGPVVMVGLGGIWTEALNDVRLLPPDLSHERIAAEIGRLKGAPVLQGLRGAAQVDVAAVADVARRIGALMRAQPEITEIDINPLVAYSHGVLALDALIVSAA